MASICCSPPDRRSALRSRHLLQLGQHLQQLVLAVRCPAASVRPAARQPQVLADGEPGRTSARPSGHERRGPGQTSWYAGVPPIFSPDSSTVPAIGWFSPAIVSSVVVFPAPFGPSSAHHLARADLQVELADDRDAPVARRQVPDDEGVAGPSGSVSGWCPHGALPR